MCKGKEKDLSWEEKVRKNREEGKADGEFSVIWELFEEFEEWLKESSDGAKDIDRTRWFLIFRDIRDYCDISSFEKIEKFIKAGTGKGKRGWFEVAHFFDESESKYLLEFLEVKKTEAKKQSESKSLWQVINYGVKSNARFFSMLWDFPLVKIFVFVGLIAAVLKAVFKKNKKQKK